MINNRIILKRIAGCTALLASAFLLSSCGDKNAQVNTPTSPAVVAATPGPEASASPVAATETPVTIFKVGTAADGSGELEPVKTDIDVKNPTAAVLALNKMAESADSPLPKGTRVRSVRFDEELATVDFSQEFESNFEGGDMKEALMFNSILNTLGQFPKVRKVQLLVEGKKVSIGGTQDTEQPLNVPKDKIASAKTQ